MIIDWEMPVIDGAQLVRMIRTPGEFPAPDVPIIMLSAHSDHWRVVELARIGANEFVRKPVSIKTLEDRIRRGHQPAAADCQARWLLRADAAPAGSHGNIRRRYVDEDSDIFDVVHPAKP